MQHAATVYWLWFELPAVHRTVRRAYLLLPAWGLPELYQMLSMQLRVQARSSSRLLEREGVLLLLSVLLDEPLKEHRMPWQALPFEDLPPHLRERYLTKTVMLTATVRLYSLDPGHSSTALTVPVDSRLRDTAKPGDALLDVAQRLTDSIASAASQALVKLVQDAGRLLPARNAQQATGPALELEVLLHGFGGDNAEVRLGMPNPLVFRRALAVGRSLQSIVDEASTAVRREVAAAVHTEVVERGILSN